MGMGLKEYRSGKLSVHSKHTVQQKYYHYFRCSTRDTNTGYHLHYFTQQYIFKLAVADENTMEWTVKERNYKQTYTGMDIQSNETKISFLWLLLNEF